MNKEDVIALDALLREIHAAPMFFSLHIVAGTAERAADMIAALAARVAELHGALSELAALVRGECPSLLDEDSGGDAMLDMQIDAALSGADSGSQS